MGGCCCCLPRSETHSEPVYTYCPQTSAEQEDLSLSPSTSSSTSSGVFVDTNLETSIPDAYRVPPAPSSNNMGLEHSQILHGSFGSTGNKSDHVRPTDPGLLVESVKPDCENDSLKVNEDNITASAMDQEEDCPICLEEYGLENPQIFTKCEHHFHLSCILEWMERSDNCPICDQIMVLQEKL